jgi:hypothetical protein
MERQLFVGRSRNSEMMLALKKINNHANVIYRLCNMLIGWAILQTN